MSVRSASVATLSLAVMALAGCASNAAFPAPQAAPPAVAEPSPYLDADVHRAVADAAPPAPAPGSQVDLADRREAAALAELIDSDRWRLAQLDDELAPAVAVGLFDCALNTRLAESRPPALLWAMSRVMLDAGAAAEIARLRSPRPRPFVDDPGRALCVRP
ncbi:MAG TPA: PA-phosphatase, partial [Caulobacteraceae bacterium]